MLGGRCLDGGAGLKFEGGALGALGPSPRPAVGGAVFGVRKMGGGQLET